MDETTFLVHRLSNEAGKFIVMPGPSSERPLEPPFGIIPPSQTFRGTEEETRGFFADKGQAAWQIEILVDRAKNSPEINAPEYIVTNTLRVP
jgi:hypothetical protein